jgi:RNA polymerase sigma-70 factor (ECF subfamily)
MSFLVYRTGDRALAEDLLSETFERVLRSGGSFDRRRASEKTWLYTIALNLLRDHARRIAAGQRAVARVLAGHGGAEVGDELEAVEDRDAVQRALRALAEEEREAVALRFGADLTFPEIAHLTGQKLTTVEGRVYRALRRLRDELG